MADEVYKILQSRLRKQAQQDTCNDPFDCDGCRIGKTEDQGKRKRPSSEVMSNSIAKKFQKVPIINRQPYTIVTIITKLSSDLKAFLYKGFQRLFSTAGKRWRWERFI